MYQEFSSREPIHMKLSEAVLSSFAHVLQAHFLYLLVFFWTDAPNCNLYLVHASHVDFPQSWIGHYFLDQMIPAESEERATNNMNVTMASISATVYKE